MEYEFIFLKQNFLGQKKDNESDMNKTWKWKAT